MLHLYLQNSKYSHSFLESCKRGVNLENKSQNNMIDNGNVHFLELLPVYSSMNGTGLVNSKVN